MAVLFISDLHLDADRPESIDAFVKFVSKEAIYAERLYILGDLFEVWIGDDDDDDRMQPVLDALALLHNADVPCYLMHGNRDFLIGSAFAAETGCTILPDYATVDVYGKSTLLTHGDLLCTDDKAYLKLRKMVRDPAWQKDFLSKSVSERREIAQSIRELSKSETAEKPSDIMDVNQAAVVAAMRDHRVHHLIHGHTHRPGVFRFDLNSQVATRIVLGDWYEQGTILSWSKRSFRLTTLIDG